MSKEMMCPVCKKAKLVRFFNPLTGKYHEDYDCPYRLCNFRGNEVAVNALIQSQQQLKMLEPIVAELQGRADINAEEARDSYDLVKQWFEKYEQSQRDLNCAKQALDWLGNNRLAENPVRVEQLRQYARKAIAQITHDKGNDNGKIPH